MTPFGLRTGHCGLNSHLFRHGRNPSGLCAQCNTTQTVTQFLIAYPKLQSQRAKLRKTTDKLGIRFEYTFLVSKTSVQLIDPFVKKNDKEFKPRKQSWGYKTHAATKRQQLLYNIAKVWQCICELDFYCWAMVIFLCV